MAKKFNAKGSGASITKIMAGAVVVVLALGVYAVYGQISTNIKDKKLAEYNATIAQRADSLGMEADEFLELYGLKDSGLTGKNNEKDAYDKMTLANYVKFNNNGNGTLSEEEFAEFKASDVFAAFKAQENSGITDDITMDSDSAELKSAYSAYMQQKQQEAEAAQQAAQQNADAGVSADTDIAAEDSDAAAEDAADADTAAENADTEE